jgi:hypothetical protein
MLVRAMILIVIVTINASVTPIVLVIQKRTLVVSLTFVLVVQLANVQVLVGVLVMNVECLHPDVTAIHSVLVMTIQMDVTTVTVILTGNVPVK